MQYFRLLGPILLTFPEGWVRVVSGVVWWVGWLVSGWWVGRLMEVSMAKRALGELFQTQVSLTPYFFIRDIITEYCYNPQNNLKLTQLS